MPPYLKNKYLKIKSGFGQEGPQNPKFLTVILEKIMANVTKPSLLWGETDSVLHEACPLALKDNRKCVPLKDRGMTMNIVLIKNDKQIC
jgi:hypothetical protein